MKKIIKVFLFLFILSLMPTLAFAGKKSGYGKIVEVEGEVSMKRCGGDKKFKAIKGMKLVEGDILYTGEKSSASIILDNNSQVVIGENSTVNLAEMKKMEGKKSSTVIQLKKGSVFSKVKKKLTGKERFEIRTSNAVAGVRGTEFYVKVVDGNTYTYVLKGKVELKSYYSDKKLIVKKEQLAATDVMKAPYLIEDNKDTLLNGIKGSFYGEYEKKDYSYEQGRSNTLDEEEHISVDNNNLSVRYDAEDMTDRDSDFRNRKQVFWHNPVMECEMEVNEIILNQTNTSGIIGYINILDITVKKIHTPIPGASNFNLFRKKVKLQTNDGQVYEVPLVVDVYGTLGTVEIDISDLNLSSSTSITIEII